MLLTHAIDLFVEKRREDRMSEATISLNRCYLRQFARHVGEDATEKAFEYGKIRTFVRTLEDEGIRPRSRMSVILTLRVFGAFLISKRLLKTNPADDLPLPRLDATRIKTISDEEISRALEACARFHNAQRGALALVTLSLLVYTGIRRNELLALCLPDIDLDEASVTIRHGKGDKDRKVYLPDEGIEAVRNWLLHRPETTHDHVLMYNSVHPVADGALKSLLEEVAAIAGITGGNLLPHAIRRAVATRLHTSDVPLNEIRHMLGHASLTTTQVYLINSPQSGRDAAKKAVPPSLRKTDAVPERSAGNSRAIEKKPAPKPTGRKLRPDPAPGKGAAWRRGTPRTTTSANGRFVRQAVAPPPDRRDRRR